MSPVRLRIRELRDAQGWSQAELAEKAGLRRATVSDLENGRTRGIDFETLEKLARVFRVDPGLLIVRTRP